MKKSDQERLKKIVSIWEEVQTQILDKNISEEAMRREYGEPVWEKDH